MILMRYQSLLKANGSTKHYQTIYSNKRQLLPTLNSEIH
jgi:hypothetical protein